jgi:hypothetical protein
MSDLFDEYNEFEEYMNNLFNKMIQEFFQIKPTYEEDLEEEKISLPKELFLGENFIDKKTDAKVIFLPNHYFPRKGNRFILGFYNPYYHIICLPKSLINNRRLLKHVFLHEQAHALGILNENEADYYADISDDNYYCEIEC